MCFFVVSRLDFKEAKLRINFYNVSENRDFENPPINKKENNVVGIISNSSDNQKALIDDSLQINFDLLWVERSLFQNISKRVPVLFYVKNDTIKKIERN